MTTPPPPRRRRRQWFFAALVVLGAAGAGGWYVYQNGYLPIPSPANYADPDGAFTAVFPNAPAATPTVVADPKMLLWGERGMKARVGRREYAVTVHDGLNHGDQETSPTTRDRQADDLLVLLAVNSHGDIVQRRTVTHESHVGREVVIAGRDDGKLMAVRVIVGETGAVRMTVHGPGDKGNPGAALAGAAGFFESVKLGPAFGPPVLEEPVAMNAAELAAAYKSDATVADRVYKGRWLRVTGRATQSADGGFELDDVVTLRRAPPARKTMPVRSGALVTATGKCEGLEDGKVQLKGAVVVRPPG